MQGRTGDGQPTSSLSSYVLRGNKMSIGENMGITASQGNSTTFTELVIHCLLCTKHHDRHHGDQALRHNLTQPFRGEAHIAKLNSQHTSQVIRYTKFFRRGSSSVPTQWNSQLQCSHCVYCWNHQATLVLPRLAFWNSWSILLPLYLQSEAMNNTDTFPLWFSNTLPQ